MRLYFPSLGLSEAMAAVQAVPNSLIFTPTLLYCTMLRFVTMISLSEDTYIYYIYMYTPCTLSVFLKHEATFCPGGDLNPGPKSCR